MQIRSPHREGSWGASPPLPVLASCELSRELVGRTPEAACLTVAAEGAGSRAEASKLLSACSVAQDGGHLPGRAHTKTRSGDEGAVSGLFSLRGSGSAA